MSTVQKPAAAAPTPDTGADAASPSPEAVTISGYAVDPVYGPGHVPVDDPADPTRPHPRIGRPGAFPFTRGIHAGMYSTRLWTMRQFAGFGSAAATNARFK